MNAYNMVQSSWDLEELGLVNACDSAALERARFVETLIIA